MNYFLDVRYINFLNEEQESLVSYYLSEQKFNNGTPYIVDLIENMKECKNFSIKSKKCKHVNLEAETAVNQVIGCIAEHIVSNCVSKLENSHG